MLLLSALLAVTVLKERELPIGMLLGCILQMTVVSFDIDMMILCNLLP